MEPRQRLVVGIVGGVVVLLLIAGIWWLRTRDPGASWQGAQVPIGAGSETGSVPKTSSPTTRPSTAPIVYPADADHDGVSDADEKMHGTDLNNPDSDQDGYSDFEEIYSMGSNPLQADPRRPYQGLAPAPAPSTSPASP